MGRVLVAGLGVSGAAAARVLLARGDDVALTDAREPAVVAELVAAGVRVSGLEVERRTLEDEVLARTGAGSDRLPAERSA